MKSKSLSLVPRLHRGTPLRAARLPVAGLLLFAVLNLLLAGCGGDKLDLVEASGTVIYDGKPVPEASVLFVPDDGGAPALGRTDDEGQFTMATSGQEGVAAGSYKVGITAARNTREVSDEEFDEMTDAQRDALVEWLVPKKYSNPKTSGLTAVVSEDASENQYNFELP